MSDSNLGKKMVEEQHLSYFLDAYRTVTGTDLTVAGSGESPDFICARPSGELVGVELARSPHDYERAVDDRIWGDGTMESYDLLDAISGMITAKQRKRESPHWRTPNNTILVVELLNYSFDSLRWAEDSSLSDDYASAGFIEIWLADHSTIEAFGEVRLIGLYFAFARTLVAVQSRRTEKKTGKTTFETRYYLSSQQSTERSHEGWINLIRGHWGGIENRNQGFFAYPRKKV